MATDNQRVDDFDDQQSVKLERGFNGSFKLFARSQEVSLTDSFACKRRDHHTNGPRVTRSYSTAGAVTTVRSWTTCWSFSGLQSSLSWLSWTSS